MLIGMYVIIALAFVGLSTLFGVVLLIENSMSILTMQAKHQVYCITSSLAYSGQKPTEALCEYFVHIHHYCNGWDICRRSPALTWYRENFVGRRIFNFDSTTSPLFISRFCLLLAEPYPWRARLSPDVECAAAPPSLSTFTHCPLTL